MAQVPTARRIGVFMMEIGGETVVQDRFGHEIARLDTATAAVLDACDGEADVKTIATRLGLAPADVWAALDRLADLDLLTARVSPPGSARDVSRRRLLGCVSLGLGVAGLSAGAAMASVPAEALGKASPGSRPAEPNTASTDRAAPAEQQRKRGTGSDLAAGPRRGEQAQKRAGEDELAAGPRREQAQKRAGEDELAAGPRREQAQKRAGDDELAAGPRRGEQAQKRSGGEELAQLGPRRGEQARKARGA
jgi:hypothetical protein